MNQYQAKISFEFTLDAETEVQAYEQAAKQLSHRFPPIEEMNLVVEELDESGYTK